MAMFVCLLLTCYSKYLIYVWVFIHTHPPPQSVTHILYCFSKTPTCACKGPPLFQAVNHLNDKHGEEWSSLPPWAKHQWTVGAFNPFPPNLKISVIKKNEDKKGSEYPVTAVLYLITASRWLKANFIMYQPAMRKVPETNQNMNFYLLILSAWSTPKRLYSQTRRLMLHEADAKLTQS